MARASCRPALAGFLIGIVLEVISPSSVHAQTANGFDLSDALIPAGEILSGGPPRDGIPALTDPRFETVRQASGWMREDDRLLALEVAGEAKAYPLRILVWHEVANDRVGGRPVLITYCPLCGTGMAFDPVVRGKRRIFGVSGLLYNSDVLMYDRGTESLWSQIARRAVTGPLRGSTLELLPLVHTTWGRWRREHPNGLVLSRQTGHERDYDRDPYLIYASDPRATFPVSHRDPRLPEKELILGIEKEGAVIAFPLSALEEGPRPVRARVGPEDVFVYWFRDSWTAFATDLKGRRIPATIAYWFAWSAFHPDTQVWHP
ncbi:MAG: DUF3179 domain-containing protein [Gemmatimonadota bacterium]